MRRFAILPLLLITALLAGGCSDETSRTPAEPTLDPYDSTSDISACSPLGVLLQIVYLVPRKVLLDAIKAKFAEIPTTITPRNRKTAQQKALAVVDFILKAYYAGQLRTLPNDPDGSKLKAKVITLINSLYCLVRLTPPPISLDDLGPDGAVAVVGPTTDKAVTTGNGQAGVDINPGDVPFVTTIVITRLPDSPQPLNTTLNQYPPFYHFSTTPEVEFNNAVVTGICVEDPGVPLLLAHNVGSGIEILPFANPTFLDCDNFEEFGFFGGGAKGVWTWAMRALLPNELHASAALATAGVGGTTKKFSPFGAVEEGISFTSFNYRFLDLGTEGTPPEGFQEPGFDDTEWGLDDAGFGEHVPPPECELIASATRSPWGAAGVEETTHIVLRKTFTVSTDAARITVPVDNDVRVFVNGQELTEGFLEHEGCPTRETGEGGAFVFQVFDLTPNTENLLAILARDRGASSYVDARVEPLFTE
jgi:hypothetical protein